MTLVKLNTMTKLGLLLAAALAGAWFYFADFDATIEIDPGTRFQEIHGWEAISPGHWELERLDLYRDELLRAAYVDLGLTRYRLEVRSGVEAPIDEYARMVSGEIKFSEYRKYWYRPLNDDDDPRHINPEGFHFTELDGSVEKIVKPLQTMLAAEGRKLDINLCYVAFSEQSLPSKLHEDPEEYAEFVLATLLHLREKYDLVPDTWQVHLEPDSIPGWSGQKLGKLILAAHARLKEAGFDLKFVGPSTTTTSNAVPFFRDMVAVEGVKELMAELSYHRYRGFDDAVLKEIARTAQEFETSSAMLELIDAWDDTLHEDLTLAEVSAWMQYSIGGPRDPKKGEGGGFYWIDESNPAKPVLREHSKTRYLRQYFRYIRPGARRIGASSTSSRCKVVAFENKGGKLAIVLNADRAGKIHLKKLPKGRYVFEYSTASERAKRLDPFDHTDGETIDLTMPAAGVGTLIQLD